ncbi:antibiotic transporter [Bacillus sp. FJAT-22090]|uniref:DMT family transporter n=1 Tax=Bacillus sp. FJAT-22090 TaxID=1581038 RepID=UPI0006AEBCBB|nr:DMT family transporter [Bacillus sp. FJAT-22090]ALC86681.1 antibiotic transporter [Bacillus sp. FJAT-22090]
MNSVPPIALLIIATLLWGGNFAYGRAVADELPPFTFAFIRWCLAFIIFLPIVWNPLKKEWKLIKRYWQIVLAMSLTGIVGFTAFLYLALHYTTSINASIVNTTTPILIYIISFVFFKERLNKNQLLGTFVSLIGLLCIISKGSFKSFLELSFNRGDLLVVTAVICWSIYSILVKQYSQRLPVHSTFQVTILVGIFILFPFFLYETWNPAINVIWSIKSISAIFYTGIFASIVAFLSWNTGVVKIGANKAGIYLNLIPVFATVFAVLFIEESIQLFHIVGGFFTILGVYLTSKKG